MSKQKIIIIQNEKGEYKMAEGTKLSDSIRVAKYCMELIDKWNTEVRLKKDDGSKVEYI